MAAEDKPASLASEPVAAPPGAPATVTTVTTLDNRGLEYRLSPGDNLKREPSTPPAGGMLRSQHILRRRVRQSRHTSPAPKLAPPPAAPPVQIVLPSAQPESEQLAYNDGARQVTVPTVRRRPLRVPPQPKHRPRAAAAAMPPPPSGPIVLGGAISAESARQMSPSTAALRNPRSAFRRRDPVRRPVVPRTNKGRKARLFMAP